MALSNSNAAAPQPPHARRNSRIVPVIPRQLARPRQSRLSVTEAKVEPTANIERDGAGAEEAHSTKPVLDSAAVEKPLPDMTSLAEEPSATAVEPEEAQVAETGPTLVATPSDSTTSGTRHAIPAVPGTVMLENAETASAVQSTTASEPPVTTQQAPTKRIRTNGFKTELAPPFIPASASRGTASVAELRNTSDGGRYVPAPPSHASKASTDHIVFGGKPESSSSSSPAPPASAGSGFVPTQGPAYMGNAPFPPVFSPGHAHHPSGGSRAPLNNLQHPGPYAMQHDVFYGPQPPPNWIQSPTQSPYEFPPPQGNRRSPQVNGFTPTARSDSQGSLAMNEQQDPRRNLPPHMHGYSQRGLHVHDSRHGLGMPAWQPDERNLRDIRDYLLGQLTSSEFADYIIQLVATDNDVLEEIPGHRLLLARSPKLRSLMHANTHELVDGRRALRIPSQFWFKRTDAFADVISYLYGGPLLDDSRVLASQRQAAPYAAGGSHSEEVSLEQMAFLMSYVAAGTMLDLPEVAFRGLDIANRFLRWENVETALSFALLGGLSSYWRSDDAAEDQGSSTSSEDLPTLLARNSEPVYDPHATPFLHHIINFLVFNFPRDFVLDPTTPYLFGLSEPSPVSRHEARASISDPRLKGIRFGEVSTDDLKHASAPPAARELSKILLSVPFAVLKCILEHHVLCEILPLDVVAQHMHAVIGERERRRTKGMNKPLPLHRAAQQVPADAYTWEESVEASEIHRAGFRLVRRRKGADTPPSSASVASSK